MPDKSSTEGQSEATKDVVALLDAMETYYDAAYEALGIQFGAQEVTRATWRKWFLAPTTTPEERMAEIRQRGAQAVIADLGMAYGQNQAG